MHNVFKDFSIERPVHPAFALLGKGFVMLVGLSLMAVMLWFYAEFSGLIAQQTGVREAVWMAIAVIMLFGREGSPLPVPGLISVPVLIAYPLNAVIMLWDAQTLVFWVAVFLLVARVVMWLVAAVQVPFPDFARRTYQPPVSDA